MVCSSNFHRAACWGFHTFHSRHHVAPWVLGSHAWPHGPGVLGPWGSCFPLCSVPPPCCGHMETEHLGVLMGVSGGSPGGTVWGSELHPLLRVPVPRSAEAGRGAGRLGAPTLTWPGSPLPQLEASRHCHRCGLASQGDSGESCGRHTHLSRPECAFTHTPLKATQARLPPCFVSTMANAHSTVCCLTHSGALPGGIKHIHRSSFPEPSATLNGSFTPHQPCHLESTSVLWAACSGLRDGVTWHVSAHAGSCLAACP